MKILVLSDHTADQLRGGAQQRERAFDDAQATYARVVERIKALRRAHRAQLAHAIKAGNVRATFAAVFRLAHAYLLTIPKRPQKPGAGEDEHKWASGHDGEQRAAVHWAGLWDDRWTLIGGYVTRKGEIDQLLIGPAGVFAIEIKNLNGVVHCDGDRWWRDKYDKYGNLVQQAVPIADRTGRSPSQQVNEMADALKAVLQRGGFAVRVVRMIALVHERSGIGKLNRLTVNTVGLLGSFQHQHFVSSATLLDQEVGQIVAAIAHDHQLRTQRQTQPDAPADPNLDKLPPSEPALPGVNWKLAGWISAFAVSGMASWLWTKNAVPLYAMSGVFAAWLYWIHPGMRRKLIVLLLALPWLIIAYGVAINAPPPGLGLAVAGIQLEKVLAVIWMVLWLIKLILNVELRALDFFFGRRR